MAHEVKKWACDHKCGYSCSRKRSVEAHEGHCFRNPEVRACKTCKHDDRERMGVDEGGGFENFCAIDQRPSGMNAITGCMFWEAKP